MLPYILALIIGFGSLAFYMAAFFFPEVHRKNDFIWSGIGLFYALILWVCGERITGAVLLGQMASVSLLGWLGWQTLTMRLELTSPEKRTEISPEILEKIKNLSIGGFGQQLLQPITSLLGKKQVKTPPAPTVMTATVVETPPAVEDSPQAQIPDWELEATIEAKTIEVAEKGETVSSASNWDSNWEPETVSSSPEEEDTGITPRDIISAIAEPEVAPSPTEDNLSTVAETTEVTEPPQTQTASTDDNLATAAPSTEEFSEETWEAIAPPTPAAEAVAEKPEANLSPVKEKSGPIKQVSGLFKNFFSKKRSGETNQIPKTTELQTLPEQAIALSDEVSTSIDTVTPAVTESPEPSEVSWQTNVIKETVTPVESKTPKVTESPEPSAPSELSWESSVISEEVTPVESKTPEVTESPEPSEPSELSWEPSVISEEVTPVESKTPEVTESPEPPPLPEISAETSVMAEEMTPVESKTPEVTESPEPPAPLGSPWDTIMTAEKVTESATESEIPETTPAVEDTTPSESPKIIFRNRPNSKLIELLKNPTSSDSPESKEDTTTPPEQV